VGEGGEMDEERKQLVEELTTNFRCIIRRFRADINQLFESYIPLNEFFVLRILKRDKQQMVSKIANELTVSNSHITAVTEKLIKRGLIERNRCNNDRRVVYLDITEEGILLVSEMEEMQENYMKEKFNCYSDEEIQLLNDLFKRMV
jgi:DNA-binding MarR family transcriptional regulator